MKYSEIQSEYIKKKLQETSWLEHQKIDELLCLYKYIRHAPTQFNSGMLFSFLKTKHEEDYFELLREFSITAFQSAIEEKEKRKQMNIKLDELDAKKETLLRQEWIKAGGKL